MLAHPIRPARTKHSKPLIEIAFDEWQQTQHRQQNLRNKGRDDCRECFCETRYSSQHLTSNEIPSQTQVFVLREGMQGRMEGRQRRRYNLKSQRNNRKPHRTPAMHPNLIQNPEIKAQKTTVHHKPHIHAQETTKPTSIHRRPQKTTKYARTNTNPKLYTKPHKTIRTPAYNHTASKRCNSTTAQTHKPTTTKLHDTDIHTHSPPIELPPPPKKSNPKNPKIQKKNSHQPNSNLKHIILQREIPKPIPEPPRPRLDLPSLAQETLARGIIGELGHPYFPPLIPVR